MAKPAKRSRKPTASKVSKKMASVRPIRTAPTPGRRYDPGFTPPPQKNPWQDEGQGD